MKFGSKVFVLRGGSPPPGQPGCFRRVRGILVGARGHERMVRLTEDDPLASIAWCKKGDVGRWSASAVIPRGGTQ